MIELTTIKTEQSHRDALTEKELEKLEHYREQLKEPNETLNAFLFSCYTGLRYSDMCIFTKQNIRTINRKKMDCSPHDQNQQGSAHSLIYDL